MEQQIVRHLYPQTESFKDKHNGMWVTIMRLRASRQEDLKEALWNAGMRYLGTIHLVTKPEETYMKRALTPSERKGLRSGLQKIVIRERTEFSHKGDILVLIDIDFVDAKTTIVDPIAILYEKKKGRMEPIVRETLTDVSKIDLIKNALKGILSKQFKQSVDDLAKLENCSPQQLYRKYCDVIIRSCVRSVKDGRLECN